VGLAAVVVIGANDQRLSHEPVQLLDAAGGPKRTLLSESLECVEVAGCSLAERMIERFAAVNLETVCLLVESETLAPRFRGKFANLEVRAVSEVNAAIREALSGYSQQGIDHAFISSANAYVETDLLYLFCFHREARQAVTKTIDREGPLGLWVVDCAKTQALPMENFLEDAGQNRNSEYFIREYVKRLNHPGDLRQFASDMLRGRCRTGPCGREVRPGVWLDEEAEIHRRARIVAPAYIGCESKVQADALITRFSNIERDCCIECGTVVEDSSVLANTSVGIWLDLCHAVVSGNMLLNLEREVLIEIPDPRVLRPTIAGRKFVPKPSERGEAVETVSDLQEPGRLPDTWQFGNNNLIQE